MYDAIDDEQRLADFLRALKRLPYRIHCAEVVDPDTGDQLGELSYNSVSEGYEIT